MTMTRRRFVSVSLASAAAAATPNWSAAQESAGTWRELRRGVGIYTELGGTIGWHLGPEALVVVDSQMSIPARHFLAAVRERSARRIDVLVNTHHHGDHTGGNGVLEPESESIVAHENVPLLQLKAARRRGNVDEQVVAHSLFTHGWRSEIGSEVVSAQHHGPAHTGGDSVVHFEKAGVVHMGDLVFNRWYPFIDRQGGGSVKGWITVLERVIASYPKEAVFVFGHGSDRFGVTGSVADLALQRDFFSALLDHVESGIATGEPKARIIAAESLPGFDDHESRGSFLTLERCLEAAYLEITDGPTLFDRTSSVV